MRGWWTEHHGGIQLNWEVDPELTPLVRLSDESTVRRMLGRNNWAPESYVALVEGLSWLAGQWETFLANQNKINLSANS